MVVPAFPARQKARFFPPKPLDGELERPRLLEAIQANIFRKLTLLVAAPGYGKSTLAAQFARSSDFPVAWLQLDEGDRDASILCTDILFALQAALPEWTPPPLNLIGLPAVSENPGALGSALSEALDQALPDFTVLVIDDFHLVEESQQIVELVNAVLRNMPPALHLLLISRHIPGLHITPLVAAQQTAGFSEEHLRFTPGEVQDLVVSRNRISLPAAEADALVSVNEGWVTGILMSSHLLWRGLPLGEGLIGRDRVYQFLASEVLEQQPDALRRFMLESSVLVDMDRAACDFLLDRTDSRELLAQLDSRRLFVVASGEDQPTYRFHNLFREFLLAQLQKRDSARHKALLEKSAEWHIRIGMPEAAFSYFTQAGNLPQAARLAEEQVQRIYESGRAQTLQDWARRLYPVRFEVPRVYVCAAMTLGMGGNFAKAEEYLNIAEEGLERAQHLRARRNSLQVTRAWLAYRRGEYEKGWQLADSLLQKGAAGGVEIADLRMAAEHAGRCAAALGRIPEAIRCLREALEKFPADERSYDRAHVLTELANTLQTSGATAESYILQRRALAIWRELGYPGPIAIALNNLAYDQHMMAQLDEAEASYTEAMEWSRKSGDKHSQMLIYTGLGDLLKDRGEYSKAAGYYASADNLAEDAGDPAMLGFIYRAWADLNRRLKNFPAAMEWIQRAEGLAEEETKITRALDRVFEGTLREEMGRSEEALKILGEAAEALERAQAPAAAVAGSHFLLARSLFRSGNSPQAEASLRKAFDLSFSGGSDQNLVREAGAAADLLAAFTPHPVLGGYCVSLVERSGRQMRRGRTGELPNPAAEPMALEVKALGTLEISWSGSVIPRAAWTSQKTKEVFLYLVDRSPAAREDLLAVFWPEMPTGRALANLYQTLYRIRRAVGADILLLRDQVCRIAENISVAYDVSAFEKSAREALARAVTDRKRLTGLEKAAALFRGEYLKDVPVDWASQRREEINQLFLAVIREAADECLSVCRYEEGRACAARGLEIDPFRDDLHQRMLKLLAAMGRKHEVVDHYQKYVLLLRNDLGLDPPLETRALYDSLIS
jgi:ATP/maltotriose-dependent transcriptional regulator MalT/DNA-binding SARP family transcriptional activator